MAESGSDEVQIVGRDLEVDDQESSTSANTVSQPDQKSDTSTVANEEAFRTENGRRYHAFEDRQYWLPNDSIEINRLDLQHSIWKLSFSGQLYISPIQRDVQRVLDVGTGTGAWVIDFAKEHPNTKVLGTDLSPIQPENVPENCSFVVHNAESDWVFEDKFDFIQGRMLFMGIHDWPAFFKKAWENLKPGGYLEVSNPEFPLCCDDDSVDSTSPFMRWSQLVSDATAKDGIDGLIIRKFRTMIEEQGFVNIRDESLKWPCGPWAKGEQEKTIGYCMLPNIRAFISPSALALFTKKLGWAKEDVEEFVKAAEKDVEDPGTHYYCQM
jgi:SAM-dependent methyltransferase